MTGFQIGAVLALAAASAGPAKLVVLRPGVAITDYPSMARCEAARVYVAKLIAQRNAAIEPQRLPNGGVVSDMPLSVETLCIPG